MSEKVDLVAKAIDEASQPPGQKDYKILMENCARAAIEAMRKQPEHYFSDLVRRFNLRDDELHRAAAREWYEAMIDECLK